METNPDFMLLEDAIEIVLQLARANVIDDPELAEEAAKQKTAIDTVLDFFTNNVFD